eukprot:TRINITY_DN12053_c0_g2_i1.p1 TRINITY_DN12053_c0_g2~~TRINITY_DN12053_c0_g2_i1.p1  ORF type:complete len:427 (-),score=79.64 TRINITY_DN12053_c0_g2_i1:107-1387(-)
MSLRWSAAAAFAAATFSATSDADASFAASGGLSPQQLERKRALIAEHPLYGPAAPIACRDLPQRWTLARHSWKLPTRWSFAFLVQGEDDVASKEAAMWSDSSDFFWLTYRRRREDAIFCPDLVVLPTDKSAFSRGRNTLLLAAQMEEMRRGYAYMYYVFMDSDLEASGGWSHSLPGFLSFLRTWEPAVGVPLYWNTNVDVLYTHLFNWEHETEPTSPRSIYWHDHCFVATHHEAAKLLYPHDSDLDTGDAMISQWYLSGWAALLFRNHVLVDTTFEVSNPGHGRPPDDAVQARCENASLRIRRSIPEHLRECVLDPWNAFAMAFSESGFRARHIRAYVKGDLRLEYPERALEDTWWGETGTIMVHSYYPWGRPSKKTWDYSTATVDKVPGCGDEPQYRNHRWRQPCPGLRSRQTWEWLACARHFKL